ncbi:hypothetical protein OAQ99_07780, partial [Candidatus Kapabacteria bacterium]|nr:hypothetical protein [Candidatus Kapabacteria bacterium]
MKNLTEFKSDLLNYKYTRSGAMLDANLIMNSNRLAILVIAEVSQCVVNAVRKYKNHDLLFKLNNITNSLDNSPNMLLLEYVKNPKIFKDKFKKENGDFDLDL